MNTNTYNLSEAATELINTLAALALQKSATADQPFTFEGTLTAQQKGLMTSLKKKGLIISELVATENGRTLSISFTEAGRELVVTTAPVEEEAPAEQPEAEVTPEAEEEETDDNAPLSMDVVFCALSELCLNSVDGCCPPDIDDVQMAVLEKLVSKGLARKKETVCEVFYEFAPGSLDVEAVAKMLVAEGVRITPFESAEQAEPAKPAKQPEPKAATTRTGVIAMFAPLPAAGTVLKKTYKGQTYEATLHENGSVDVNGTHYTSLTQAARSITGYKNISGRKFFGCAAKKPVSTEA